MRPASVFVGRLQLVGKGTGATQAGILFTNSNNNYLVKTRVRNFGKGVYFAKGANSCYLNTLEKCIIENNLTDNIYGEGNTNALHLISTQFGGSAQRGLYLVDSNTLAIYGGDCEGDATIEAGWPFFGQYVAHDLTADRSPLRAHADLGSLRNMRAPRANLESLYGGGPAGRPTSISAAILRSCSRRTAICRETRRGSH